MGEEIVGSRQFAASSEQRAVKNIIVVVKFYILSVQKSSARLSRAELF